MLPIAFIRTRVFKTSQKQFAAIAKSTQGTISRWENGSLQPSAEHLSRIRSMATELGLDWSDAWFFEPLLSAERSLQ